MGPSWYSSIEKHAHLSKYDRVWVHRQERRRIIALAFEFQVDLVASGNVYSAVQDLKSTAEREFAITAAPYARGFVVKYGGAEAAQGMFVQGSRAFTIGVLAPTKVSEADIELTRQLVEIQAVKAPPGSTELRGVTEPGLLTGTALVLQG